MCGQGKEKQRGGVVCVAVCCTGEEHIMRGEGQVGIGAAVLESFVLRAFIPGKFTGIEVASLFYAMPFFLNNFWLLHH